MKVQDYISTLTYGVEENGEHGDQPAGHVPKMYAEREADFRISRLNQVWGSAELVARTLSNAYRRLWDGSIVSLADRKGTLYVTWRDEVSRIMFEGIILGAWEANGEHAHHHEIAGE